MYFSSSHTHLLQLPCYDWNKFLILTFGMVVRLALVLFGISSADIKVRILCQVLIFWKIQMSHGTWSSKYNDWDVAGIQFLTKNCLLIDKFEDARCCGTKYNCVELFPPNNFYQIFQSFHIKGEICRLFCGINSWYTTLDFLRERW